jgi:hypothetical protein
MWIISSANMCLEKNEADYISLNTRTWHPKCIVYACWLFCTCVGWQRGKKKRVLRIPYWQNNTCSYEKKGVYRINWYFINLFLWNSSVLFLRSPFQYQFLKAAAPTYTFENDKLATLQQLPYLFSPIVNRHEPIAIQVI